MLQPCCTSIRLVTFTLRVRISPRPSASNLEQAANLLCAQANSASYPQRDWKWVVAHGLRGEGLVHWLGRWYVCVLHRGSNCSLSRAMDGRIMRHGIISSCQSAATSETVKRCCSSLISSAITSTQTITFHSVQSNSARMCSQLTFSWVFTAGSASTKFVMNSNL